MINLNKRKREVLTYGLNDTKLPRNQWYKVIQTPARFTYYIGTLIYVTDSAFVAFEDKKEPTIWFPTAEYILETIPSVEVTLEY